MKRNHASCMSGLQASLAASPTDARSALVHQVTSRVLQYIFPTASTPGLASGCSSSVPSSRYAPLRTCSGPIHISRYVIGLGVAVACKCEPRTPA